MPASCAVMRCCTSTKCNFTTLQHYNIKKFQTCREKGCLLWLIIIYIIIYIIIKL